jgi:hypothetical protein
MSLVYLLAAGAEFDLVINLDGFNDVALHPTENAFAKVSTLFPRGWSLRVGAVADRERLQTIGAIAYLKTLRREVAASHEQAPWRHSPLANFIWQLRDRRLGRQLFNARRSLQQLAPTDLGYLATGPQPDYHSDGEMYDQLAELWLRSSVLLERAAVANGARYYHFLQPNQYLPGSKWMDSAERMIAWKDQQPFKPPVEQGYPRLIKKGAELRRQGIHFYDLTMLFADHREPLYGDDCCHPNGAGNRLIAQAMVDAIAQDLKRQ